jgi:hypothetical protein
MKIMVFGTGNEGLRDVVKKLYPQDTFHFCSEVTSINKTFARKVVVNEEFNLSEYDAFILTSTSQIYNYLWFESCKLTWFHNPFDLRAAANHNFYFGIASSTKFKLGESKPKFEDGKISVHREFPEGMLCKFLLLPTQVISLSKVEMPKHLTRTCRAFLRDLRVRFGVVSFIVSDDFSFHLKEFSPILDWNNISEKNIKIIFDCILFTSKVVSTSRRSVY